jgi:hypothetical protein
MRVLFSSFSIVATAGESASQEEDRQYDGGIDDDDEPAKLTKNHSCVVGD